MSVKLFFVGLFIQLLLLSSGPVIADEYTQQRLQMVTEIENDVETTAKYINKESFNTRVMQAMNTVPRHEFVPAQLRDKAYENRPLPIGYGQTISQPYIVALMTDLLQPEPDHRVLEIGTGSGYQAAVLSRLVAQVYSIEIIEQLGQSTAQLLTRLDYDNIETRIADGYDGWSQHAPFDSIIVTAAISHIPPPLVQQLKKGGRLLIEKDKQGKVTSRQLLPVIFVPFTGGH